MASSTESIVTCDLPSFGFGNSTVPCSGRRYHSVRPPVSHHSDPYQSLPGFSDRLVKNGYHVMHWGKTTNKAGKRRDLTHKDSICHFSQAVSAAEDKTARKKEIFSFVRANFRRFLEDNKDDKPFFYWFGPHNSHRQWTKGSGKAIWGLDPYSLAGKVPAFLPHVPEVRKDLADYLGEALAWNGMVWLMN